VPGAIFLASQQQTNSRIDTATTLKHFSSIFHSSQPRKHYSKCPVAHGNHLNSKPKLLSELNEEFSREYKLAGQRALADVKSIMIYREGNLGLWLAQQNDYQEVDRVNVICEQYQHLKEVAHIPVLILSVIQSTETHSDMAENREKLRRIGEKLRKILQDLPSLETEVCSARKVVTESIQITDMLGLEIAGSGQKEALLATFDLYLKGIKPTLDSLCQLAAKIQLKNFQDRVVERVEKYNICLKQNRIMIVITHGPRENNLEGSCFSALYEERLNLKKIENDKLYYVEMLPQQIHRISVKEDLIPFLASQELNKCIGQKILGKTDAMFEDILNPKSSAP